MADRLTAGNGERRLRSGRGPLPVPPGTGPPGARDGPNTPPTHHRAPPEEGERDLGGENHCDVFPAGRAASRGGPESTGEEVCGGALSARTGAGKSNIQVTSDRCRGYALRCPDEAHTPSRRRGTCRSGRPPPRRRSTPRPGGEGRAIPAELTVFQQVRAASSGRARQTSGGIPGTGIGLLHSVTRDISGTAFRRGLRPRTPPKAHAFSACSGEWHWPRIYMVVCSRSQGCG